MMPFEAFIEQGANTIAGLLALILLLPYLDRLRAMHWRSHLWRVIGMHLAWALWLGWVAFHGLLIADVDGYQIFALTGAALWLLTSGPAWRDGPPEETESGPAPLGMVAERPRQFDV